MSLCRTLPLHVKEAGVPAVVVMELVGHDSVQRSEHTPTTDARRCKRLPKISLIFLYEHQVEEWTFKNRRKR